LEKKRAELAILEGELADRELAFVTLQNEARSFEARYLRVVGRLYAELDDVQAQVAEAQARRSPQNPDLHQQASAARTRATESAEVFEAILKGDDVSEFAPRDDLKKLYREIAKLVHPDLATGDVERARRTRLMADANRAYTAGDEAQLRAILDEFVSSPESVQGEGVASELVRTIRKIHQIERRLANIEVEMAELRDSQLYILFQRVETSKAQNRDLLAEMANQLTQQIADARTELTALSSGRATV
jgi:hypothetical protein